MSGAESQAQQQTPGFGERGRMRRRARFLRKARELAFRDLGGLVFDMHRFEERNDQVLGAKLATLRQIDAELRALEQALGERRAVSVLHEVGIAACPRCAAIHGRDDRFCPGCGLAFDAHADRPMATAPASTLGPLPQIPSPPRQTPSPATPPPSSPPASGPQTTVHPPPATPPSTAPPVPAPATGARPQPGGPPPEKGARPGQEGASDRDTGQGEQPTEILRPPVGGG